MKLKQSIATSTALAVGIVSGTTVVGGRSAAGAAKTTVSLTAKEYTYSGMPTKLNAGTTTFSLRNTGKLRHGLQLLRVEGQHSDKEILDGINGPEDAPIPDWAHPAGGIGTVPPGSTTQAIVNLDPGAYTYFSFENGDQDKTKADSALGMVGKFTVTGKASSEPTAAAEIVASEYTFVAHALKPGRNRIVLRNRGVQIHHLVVTKLLPGKTLADAKALFAPSGPKGPPPLDFDHAQSTAALDPNKALVTSLEFTKGSYVFACFFPDRAGGEPHAAKGMITQVDIG